MSPHYNLREAVQQVLNGAKVEGVISRTLVITSGAIQSDHTVWPDLESFLSQMLKVLHKIKTNHYDVYSVLVGRVWTVLPHYVSLRSMLFAEYIQLFIPNVSKAINRDYDRFA